MVKNILIVVVIICVVSAVWFFTKKDKGVAQNSPSPSASVTPNVQQSPGPVMTLAGGLKVQDLVVGMGAEAVNGKLLSVHYVGTLENGTKFDSSLDQGLPFSFQIGAGEVIQGWEKGVLGMKVGGKRKLIIPPALGYGSTGAGGMIPPNATIIFEVELLAVN